MMFHVPQSNSPFLFQEKYMMCTGKEVLKNNVFYKIYTRFFISRNLQFFYGRKNFQPESCLAVAYSIHSQTLVAQKLLTFNKVMLP